MKVFIDFDDSLFNTKKFRGELLRIFLGNGVSKKHFFETYYDYPRKTSKGLKKYDPFRQIRMLKKKIDIDNAKIKKDLELFIRDTKKFVFPDAKNFLAGFKKSNLFLVSYGYTEFQYKKIRNCGLFSRFFKVAIADGKKTKIIGCFVKKKEIFLFIDDRIENINFIKKDFPASVTFLLKRREGRYNDKRTKYVDYEVKSLREVSKIILNSQPCLPAGRF